MSFYSEMMQRFPENWHLRNQTTKIALPAPQIAPTPIQLTPEENNQFRMQLLNDIPYFHKLYAKYHHPEALEAAQSAAQLHEDIKKRG